MKITIHVHTNTEAARQPAPDDRDVRVAREPFPTARRVLAQGACPDCGASDEGEFTVAGGIVRYTDDREQIADAVCLDCNSHIGALRVQFDTLFGVEEDRRVLLGRPRVY